MNNRNDWVDYAKAIGILLVVYGHVVRGLINAGLLPDSPFHSGVDSIIYSFHMPLFFFLSGLFFIQTLNRRGAGGTLFNKIDTLFYPFVLWSLLQGSVEVVLGRFTNGSVSFHEVFSLLWHPRAQFWFLYALFMVFTLSVVMYRSRALYLPILAFWALIYALQPHLPDLGVGNFLVQNAVFFSLGVCFTAYAQAIGERPVRWLGAALLLFAASQYLFHHTLGRNYIDRDGLSLIVALLGIGLVVSASMWLAKHPSHSLLTVGVMSMHIYLMHILAGSGVRVILNKALGIHDPALHIVAGTVAGIVLPILAARILLMLNIRFLFEIPPRFSLARRLATPGGRPTTSTPV